MDARDTQHPSDHTPSPCLENLPTDGFTKPSGRRFIPGPHRLRDTGREGGIQGSSRTGTSQVLWMPPALDGLVSTCKSGQQAESPCCIAPASPWGLTGQGQG